MQTANQNQNPNPNRSARRRSSRPPRQASALTLLAVVLGVVAMAVALATLFIVANPDAAFDLLDPQPTSTLFLGNVTLTATPDLRETLPPTWTPSRTPRPGASPTPSRTPTRTPSPTATTTRIPTRTFTPIATLPPGWYEFAAREAKLAFHAPSTWSGLTLADREAGAVLAEMAERDPVLAASLRDGLANVVFDNLIVLAFDTATSSDPYVVNLNIAYANTIEGDTIDEIRDAHLALYGSSEFYELLADDSTTVDWQPAHRIRYRTVFPTGSDDEEEVTVYHLEVIAEGRLSTGPLIVMTLSTSQERRNIYEALLDTIVSTVRYTR